MPLASAIIVAIGGEAVALRPSLACAMRLERRPGSFRGLLDEIADGSLAAACEIIAPHHPGAMLAAHVMDTGLDALQGALMDYVLQCGGIETDAPQPVSEGGKTVPFGEWLADLYRIGTGWLGWTPADTLDATPLEIAQAYQGRLAMLKAIFGGADETPAKPDARSLDDKFRALFAARGTVKAAPKAKAE